MPTSNEDIIKKYKNVHKIDAVYYKAKDKDNNEIIVDGIINPLKIDNRQITSATTNQFDEPWCAAYSACEVAESIYWKRTGHLIQIDRGLVYAKAKEMDGNMDEDGIYPETALRAAVNLGGFQNPKEIKIKTFQTFPKPVKDEDILYIKHLIHKYDFLIGGFMIDEGWYDCGSKSWELKSKGSSIGAHAVTLCYYDTKGVGLLNHWGREWGAKGYARMPWDIFKKQFIYCSYIENAY